MPSLDVAGPNIVRIGLLALTAIFWLSMIVSLGLWVFRDSRARGSDQPLVWAFASVFTPVGLPYYFYRRYRQAGLGTRKGTTRSDRPLAVWASASVGAFLISAFLSPPDPFSQILYTLISFSILLPGAYLIVCRGGYRRFRELLSV